MRAPSLMALVSLSSPYLEYLIMTDGFFPPHGGYQKLLSYQRAEIVYDVYRRRWPTRTHDQSPPDPARPTKRDAAELGRAGKARYGEAKQSSSSNVGHASVCHPTYGSVF